MTTTLPGNPPESGDEAIPASDFYDPGPAAAAPPCDGGGGGEALPLTPEQDEAARLRAALEEANAEIARQADVAQRGQADLANARRRHEAERGAIRQQANSSLLAQLLPIVDELDLAVAHLESGGESDGGAAGDVSRPAGSWVEGVRLIQRKLAGFLEAQGVTRIEALGQPFNPELHEAVGIDEAGEAEPGSVVKVLRQGYRLHDRVVQAAQVVVGQ